MKTEEQKQKIYEAQKRKLEEILKRPRPYQVNKTQFQREQHHIVKMLEEAIDVLLIENLPEEVYTNENVMRAKSLISTSKFCVERLQKQVGYGWNLVTDYLPPHNSDVLVSLDEEMLTIARYHNEKGFLLDIDGDYVVKAWCEIPEWYDWENDEEERELTKEERAEIAADFEYDALKEEGLI